MVDDGVNVAEPGDVYEDGHGNVYQVRCTIAVPSVTMVRMLPATDLKAAPEGCCFCSGVISGGIHGLMWKDFRRISKSTARIVVQCEGTDKASSAGEDA